ncbi:biosynthetic-type acetolactate synthase large subunit [Neobacillus mesonae]|uniref:biosynthetic-type acetolactate synthase large subunit n=1 Tax=Neobacillus mesonae TaxID=1193713 RepID=UPI00203E9D00|nr:biosynthetic-type acetolactate synthase large subunit [Neobacillus mesonae]MCM3567362.1 biosynthetic-type acetolactate synthase large subunit [Neobacillus mesonae]
MLFVKEATGAEILFRSLSQFGVECVFGCDHVRHMLDESSLDRLQIRYYQLKHEQAAVHAADGYARATGKPGVVLLTTAAGVTNGVTGAATAFSDSVPLVIIAGPLLSNQYTNTALRELDISGVMMPVTKYSTKINPVTDTGFYSSLKAALTIAADGRPGPVLVELTNETAPYQVKELPKNSRYTKTIASKPIIEKSMESAKQYIEKAAKPVLFIGGGVIAAEAAEDLREIAKKAHIPVVSSLLGVGSMDAGNPLFLGMLGMHGTFAANKAVHQCDLLISIGVRFSDRVTGKISGFSPKSKKIHVDVDPAEINKIIPVDLPIVSDAKDFLSILKTMLDYPKIRANSESWTNEAVEWKRTVPRFTTSNSILSPQTVIHLLNEYADKDTIVVTDVGQHQIWTAHYYDFTQPRTLLTSGGLGTMGYGLPAAIGAAGAFPGKPVICVSGDGSFQMNLQELVTAVKYRLPIKIVILNNGYLGMVRQWQELFYQKRYSEVKVCSPNFALLANAYGAKGFSAGTEEEARQIMKEAFDCNGPVVMEFDVEEEENVYPMVPPNSNNHQTILPR